MNMMGLDFKPLSSDIEEKIDKKLSPINNVKQISLKKCKNALSKIEEGVIISADTFVVLGGAKIGKPKSKIDAKYIL